MLLQLFCPAIGILYFDIPPAVDVDLLDALTEDVFGQKAVFRHFHVQSIDQFPIGHIIHGQPVILEITGNQTLHLCAGVLGTVCDQVCMVPGEVSLHLSQNLGKGAGLSCRKQDIAGSRSHILPGKQFPLCGFLKGDVMHSRRRSIRNGMRSGILLHRLLRMGRRSRRCRGGLRKQRVTAFITQHQNTSEQIFSISFRNSLLSFMERSSSRAPAKYCSSTSAEWGSLNTMLPRT